MALFKLVFMIDASMGGYEIMGVKNCVGLLDEDKWSSLYTVINMGDQDWVLIG